MLSLSPSNYLYAITHSDHFGGEALALKTQQVLQGGCRLIQYRDKSGNTSKRLAEASQLHALCGTFDAKLIINDDVDLALQTGAAGVHLGQGDDSVALARKRLGDNAIIGVTCHASLALAEQALQHGATYIAFGRFFTSATKPNAPPAPMALLQQARARWPNTVIVAIGGINQGNANQVKAYGANYTAVCQGVYHADNIAEYSQSFSQHVNQNQNARSVL
ncbi:thiamine phosphate synthase [Gilvimarinus sp. DA14]|uniref:thiamine phosphate synthase n=1 Tax=Gilvimarinus sp. DA14 TaxID=2956798 RepID=UPI0020B80EEA|nr:thiamine phosphate synthase [Gilvimarinus sp. DA14]UTF59394.1 thiamine phosphate synthase [Gilvimarinus sp. DA14]